MKDKHKKLFTIPTQETMQYLFLTAPTARTVWNFFAKWVGVDTEGTQLYVVMRKWWVGV